MDVLCSFFALFWEVKRGQSHGTRQTFPNGGHRPVDESNSAEDKTNGERLGMDVDHEERLGGAMVFLGGVGRSRKTERYVWKNYFCWFCFVLNFKAFCFAIFCFFISWSFVFLFFCFPGFSRRIFDL